MKYTDTHDAPAPLGKLVAVKFSESSGHRYGIGLFFKSEVSGERTNHEMIYAGVGCHNGVPECAEDKIVAWAPLPKLNPPDTMPIGEQVLSIERKIDNAGRFIGLSIGFSVRYQEHIDFSIVDDALGWLPINALNEAQECCHA